MKSKITIILIVIVLFLIVGCKQNNFNKQSQDIPWIKFEWEGDSIGNNYYEKLGMFVQVRIENLPHIFSFQFDLGAPATMIYGNSFKPFLQKYPKIGDKLDTTNTAFVIQGKRVGAFNNISFYLDTVLFKNQQVAFFAGYGEKISENLLNKKGVIENMGTIGSNLFRQKVLIINFKNQEMAIMDSLQNPKELNLTDIKTENGRIKIPVKINGKIVYVLYDTGSSFASLFLSTKNWDKYRDTTSKQDTIFANAWGTQYPLFISGTNIELQIGNSVFHPETIMANKLDAYYDFFKRENIIGLMGNKLFYDKIIIIDFKNHKFGVLDNLPPEI